MEKSFLLNNKWRDQRKKGWGSWGSLWIRASDKFCKCKCKDERDTYKKGEKGERHSERKQMPLKEKNYKRKK